MFKNSRKIVKLVTTNTVGFCTTVLTKRLIDFAFEDEELTTTEAVTYNIGAIAIGAVVAESTMQYTDQLVDEVYELSDQVMFAVQKKKTETK